MERVWALSGSGPMSWVRNAATCMYTYHLPHYQRNPRLPLYICSLKEQDYSDVFFWLKSNTGGAVIAKDKIVAIDEEKGSMTFDLIGGEVTNYYKSFKATIEATSEAQTNLVKWSLEYEKANETVPSPESHLAFLLDVSKEVDAYLIKI